MADMTSRFAARVDRSISFQRIKVEKILTSTFSQILGSSIMAASNFREVKAAECQDNSGAVEQLEQMVDKLICMPNLLKKLA